MTKPRDYPLMECADAALKVIAKGCVVFQKFTCEHCGARQTIDTPNQFFTQGNCEECGGTTDIAKNGCNYLVQAQGHAADRFLREDILR